MMMMMQMQMVWTLMTTMTNDGMQRDENSRALHCECVQKESKGFFSSIVVGLVSVLIVAPAQGRNSKWQKEKPTMVTSVDERTTLCRCCCVIKFQHQGPALQSLSQRPESKLAKVHGSSGI